MICWLRDGIQPLGVDWSYLKWNIACRESFAPIGAVVVV
jgi:hypothetical protein